MPPTITPTGCECDEPDDYLSGYGGNLQVRCRNCDPSGIVSQYEITTEDVVSFEE